MSLLEMQTRSEIRLNNANIRIIYALMSHKRSYHSLYYYICPKEKTVKTFDSMQTIETLK